MKKLRCIDMELQLVSFLDYRRNLIVPNVSWGMFNHECDLVVLTKAGYCWEIEIKISKADLVRDKKKLHRHRDPKIKDLYFAVPDYLADYEEHIPQRAGIITVSPHGGCSIDRKPSKNPRPYKLSEAQRYQIARLGALRIWGLKSRLANV